MPHAQSLILDPIAAHGGHVGTIWTAYVVLTLASLVHAVTFYHLVSRRTRPSRASRPAPRRLLTLSAPARAPARAWQVGQLGCVTAGVMKGVQATAVFVASHAFFCASQPSQCFSTVKAWSLVLVIAGIAPFAPLAAAHQPSATAVGSNATGSIAGSVCASGAGTTTYALSKRRAMQEEESKKAEVEEEAEYHKI